MPELNWDGMPIHQAFKSDWKTPESLLEGSLGCAKTTAALDKEVDALLKWPGIPILLARWTEDAVYTKLKKAFEEILAIRGISFDWDAKERVYTFANGSQANMFGLKAVSAIERFNKLRGLGVCRVCVDQAEEMDRSVAGELRARLRPDLTATVKGLRYPFQLTFVANPSGDDFWLSREFPLDNHIKGRKHYSISVFDNPHLPQETVDGLLRTYAPEHPKHRTMILGKRGLNIDGDPVYERLFDRALHVRPLTVDPKLPLLESIECGRHNPTWIIAQRTHFGGLNFLGGMMGKRKMLQDFLPLVKRTRSEWFPNATIQTCTAPMGETQKTQGDRYTLLGVMRDAGFKAEWKDTANAPDVQLAMIEHVGGMLRQRTMSGEEAIGISNDPDRWLVATVDEGVRPIPFLSFAFEGGYIWSDHVVSVSNKAVRQPHDDDEHANAMRCVENIVLNFCAGQSSAQELAAKHRELAGVFPTSDPRRGPNGWLY